MMSNSSLEMYVYRFIGTGPTLAVLVVGVILALRNLQRHPRPCWFLLAALALTGFNSLGMPIIMQTVMQMMGGMSGSGNHGLIMLFYSLPYSCLSAVSWGLVLFAIFDRPDRPKFLKEDDLERDILDR